MIKELGDFLQFLALIFDIYEIIGIKIKWI